MARNVIASRTQLQLLRKRTVVKLPNVVKIVVKPGKVANLNDIVRAPPPNRTIPPAASVSKPKLLKQANRARPPRHITREPAYGSIQKAQALQNIGRGKILIIIGNGPSLTEAPIEQLKNHPKIDTLSINKPDPRLWPTTYWAFFDVSQMRRHEAIWESYNGKIFNSTAIRRQKQTSIQFKNLRGQGWSKDPSKGIYIGRSSVYASMQIAAWMGYEHTYIFGCDMNPAGLNGKLHFYGVNPDVDPELRAKRFEKEAEWYATAASVLSEAERHRFTFVTEYNPHTFVQKYRQMSHKDLTQILEHAGKL